MKICVIIPTLNEENKIAKIIKDIRDQGLTAVVIDDGSRDNTEKIAIRSGAVVLKNNKNQGKGASLIKGYDYALKMEFDAVISMDGDGQHLASDIPYFLRLAQYSDSGMIIGNRMSCPVNMPFVRLMTNKIMSWVISKAVKQGIPDTQCGFRLIKKDTLKNIKLTTSRYDTESEIIIKASKLGTKIESVPIKSVYNGEKSQINPFIDTIRFINFILREIFTKP